MYTQKGKVITLTAVKHQQGITVTAINIARYLASNTDLKVLLIDCNLYHSDIQKLLLLNDEKNIDSLISISNANMLTPEVILSSVNPDKKYKNLSYLCGSKAKTNYSITNSIKNVIDIIEVAKTHYDLIFIDTIANIYNNLTNKILEVTDQNLLFVTQDILVLQDHIQYLKSIDSNTITIVNKYEKEVYPRLEYIQGEVGTKNNLTIELPYYNKIKTLANKNQFESVISENCYYVEQIDKICSAIKSENGFVEEEVKSKSIFEKLGFQRRR